MSKRVIFGIIGALVLFIAWWSFHHLGSSDQAGSTGAPAGSGRRGGLGTGGPVPVGAGKVEQKDMPIYLDGLGTVQALNTVIVHTRVDGALVQVNFAEGQDVKTGDLLAVVDPKPYQAALDQAKAQATLDKETLNRQASLGARNEIAQHD